MADTKKTLDEIYVNGRISKIKQTPSSVEIATNWYNNNSLGLGIDLDFKLPIIGGISKEKIEIKLPEKYIINKGATVLIWKDGTKTIVKRCKEDEFNPRLGFLTAFFQHYCGMSKNKANKYLANLEVEGTKKDVDTKIQEIKSIEELKVGDKVKIRDDLKEHERYGSDTFLPDMKEYKGQICTINTIFKDEFAIDGDKRKWYWTLEMIEGKVIEKNKKEKNNG